MRKPKPFTLDCEVPADPMRVLQYEPETPGEITKRTGLNHQRVCEALVNWHRDKKIIGGKIVVGECSIPAFRLKRSWE